MIRIFTLLLVVFSISGYSMTTTCSKIFKKNYGKIKAYTLTRTYETKTLCGFQIKYNQDENSGNIYKGDKITAQIIQSKDKKNAIANKQILKEKAFDVCEHSIPITNELNCYTDKDLFSLLANKKGETIHITKGLDL